MKNNIKIFFITYLLIVFLTSTALFAEETVMSFINRNNIKISVPKTWELLINDKDLRKLLLTENDKNLTPILFAKEKKEHDNFFYIVLENKQNNINLKYLEKTIDKIEKQSKKINPNLKIIEKGYIENVMNDKEGVFLIYQNERYYQIIALYSKKKSLISFSGITNKDEYINLYKFISLHLDF